MLTDRAAGRRDKQQDRQGSRLQQLKPAAGEDRGTLRAPVTGRDEEDQGGRGQDASARISAEPEPDGRQHAGHQDRQRSLAETAQARGFRVRARGRRGTGRGLLPGAAAGGGPGGDQTRVAGVGMPPPGYPPSQNPTAASTQVTRTGNDRWPRRRRREGFRSW